MRKYSLFKSCILGTFIIALLVYITINLQHFGARNPNKPNIVFILADDLGWGDLGAYGHPYAKTPNIDQIAADGSLFHRFYVTGSVCVPSRTGFMTSRSVETFARYPKHAGFQGRMTITELLNTNGYATGHFGKWHIGKNMNKDGQYGIDVVSLPGSNRGDAGRDSEVFQEAIDFIEQHKEGPFYVNVWAHTSHFPVKPHASFSAVFEGLHVNREDFSKHMQAKFDRAESIGGNISEGMANYLGEVYALDLWVGRLLKKLDELDLRESTIVVFSSDQGPAPAAHPKRMEDPRSWNMLGSTGTFRGGKFTHFEGGIRSPFVIRWPGVVPAGKVNVGSVTSALDWLPTLATIADIDYDRGMFEGEDVSDIWKGADRSRKNPLFGGTIRRGRMYMLQGGLKIHNNKGKISLYNVSENPEEDVDLADKYPDIVVKLKKKLDEWVSTHPNQDGSKAVVIPPVDIPKNI
ncbi:sulfatase-like hydrolase/transferase [Gammaproteobacteria bacterium]|nr:sulfatase-like hydrolase/transferase [Gammaproteobacteria bacterium]